MVGLSGIVKKNYKETLEYKFVHKNAGTQKKNLGTQDAKAFRNALPSLDFTCLTPIDFSPRHFPSLCMHFVTFGGRYCQT